MALDSVRKNIVKEKAKNISNVSADEGIKNSANNHYKMANGFFKSKNFANAYYSYYLCLREYALLYARKVLKMELSDVEALDFLVKKEICGMTYAFIEIVNGKKESVLNRAKLASKDCIDIRSAVARLRKECF